MWADLFKLGKNKLKIIVSNVNTNFLLILNYLIIHETLLIIKGRQLKYLIITK